MAYRETQKVLAKKEQTKLAILRGASQLVRDERPVTMESVAVEAGLSVGSLYTYFKNRAELMVALFEWRAELELQAMVSVLHGEGPPGARIAEATAVTLRRCLANPGMALFLLLERMDRNSRLEFAKLNYHRRHCQALADTIGEGMRERSFQCRNAEVAAAAVLGTIIEVVSRALTGEPDSLAGLSNAQLEAELCDTILAICRAPSSDGGRRSSSVR